MIVVKGVSKSFESQVILENVNFSVEDAQLVVVLGPSGTGKTVLLKSIIGLLPVDDGSVLIDGVDMHKSSDDKLFAARKTIGFVFQGAALFDSMNVRENIALPMLEHGYDPARLLQKKASEILRIVGLPGKEQLYPRSLSGGMKRLVAIGRALALDPKYLFYDEPTTALDPVMKDRIVRLIVELKRNYRKSGIVVTHDLETAQAIGDSIYMLKQGKISKLEKIGKEFYG